MKTNCFNNWKIKGPGSSVGRPQIFVLGMPIPELRLLSPCQLFEIAENRHGGHFGYLSHYHLERNYQGLENRIITPDEEVGRIAGQIQCRERLGGLLKYFHRDAA